MNFSGSFLVYLNLEKRGVVALKVPRIYKLSDKFKREIYFSYYLTIKTFKPEQCSSIPLWVFSHAVVVSARCLFSNLLNNRALSVKIQQNETAVVCWPKDNALFVNLRTDISSMVTLSNCEYVFLRYIRI